MVALNVVHAQERLFLSDEKYQSISSDINGYLYITTDHSIAQYDIYGNKIKSFSNPSFGNITSIDTRIPSKILVFNQESGNITLLNNELVEINSKLNLFDKGWMNIALASMGSSDRIVLYNNIKQELLITDLNLNIVSISHIQFSEEFNPTDIQVVPNQQIALIDTSKGICLFDFYGTYEKQIPLRNVPSVHFRKNHFFYFQNGKLYKYTLPSDKSPLKIEEVLYDFEPKIKAFTIVLENVFYINSSQNIEKRTILH